MATQTRNPTSDASVAGTWTGTAGSRWTLVDDHPDSGGTDVLTHGTTAGNIMFGFSAFTVPAGSTAISIQVLYYDRKSANQTSNIAGRLNVNGTFNNVASHNPANGVLTLRTDNWANNPKTSTAWTVNDVNGVGTNGLTGFGLISTDASPTVSVSSIQLQVTYTPPDRTLRTTWSELETPNGPRRDKLVWAEFETPSGPRRLRFSWNEFEVGTAPRRFQTSWSEFEIATAPRCNQVLWGEFEAGDPPIVDRRLWVPFGEFELPTAPRRGFYPWSELEVPDAPVLNRAAWFTFTEFEAPIAPRITRISFAELESPDDLRRRVLLAFVEFQLPGSNGIHKRCYICQCCDLYDLQAQ